MSSFAPRLPTHLLHKTIEPQWLPHREEETESSLTALEAAEQAYAERLNKIIQPNSNTVIIGAGQRPTAAGRRRRRASEETSTTGTTADHQDDASTVVANHPPTAPHLQQGRFWNRRRSTTSTYASGDTAVAARNSD